MFVLVVFLIYSFENIRLIVVKDFNYVKEKREVIGCIIKFICFMLFKKRIWFFIIIG